MGIIMRGASSKAPATLCARHRFVVDVSPVGAEELVVQLHDALAELRRDGERRPGRPAPRPGAVQGPAGERDVAAEAEEIPGRRGGEGDGVVDVAQQELVLQALPEGGGGGGVLGGAAGDEPVDAWGRARGEPWVRVARGDASVPREALAVFSVSGAHRPLL